MTTTFCGYERGDTGDIAIGGGVLDPVFGGTDHLLISTPLGKDKANAFTFDFAGHSLSALTSLGYRSLVIATAEGTPGRCRP